MRILAVALFVAGTLIPAACVDGTPMHAEHQRRVVRLVRTVETTMSGPLERAYARTMPDVEIQLVTGAGPGGTVSAIQRGAADLAFILADVAYFANLDAQKRQDRSAELRGIAALQTAPVHVLAREGVDPLHVARTRPERLGLNSAFSSQFMLARLVLGGYGVRKGGEPRQVTAADAADAFVRGDIDAAFITAYYPAQSVAAATKAGARLVAMDNGVAELLRQNYPFVHLVNIPAGTYAGQTSAVRTIGVARLLVCRSDLDEVLVHELTEHFIEALPEIFLPLRTSAHLMDLDQVSGTPIPLHRGAAQYYRERELTP